MLGSMQRGMAGRATTRKSTVMSIGHAGDPSRLPGTRASERAEMPVALLRQQSSLLLLLLLLLLLMMMPPAPVGENR